MDQIEDPHELEREIERASRLASVVGDQTTYQRLKQFIEELRQALQRRLAARRSKEAIRARARELWEADASNRRAATRNHSTMASVSFTSCSVGARDRRKEETRMNMKRLILASCSVIVLGAGTAWGGPCDMGRTANKDAGSGPASQSSSQTTGMATDAKQHPPTDTMNRASGDVAASSQDTQRQMQGQPTAAQQAEGAKPGSPMNSQEAQRQMHAQPSVAEQPKGEGQTAQSQKMTAGTTEQPAPNEQSEKMTAGSAQPATSEKKTVGAAEKGC